MSKIKRTREFNTRQAQVEFYDNSTRIRSIKALLNAILNMPDINKYELSDLHDLLGLAHNNLAQAVKIYDESQEMNFTYLMRAYEKQTDSSSLVMDLLACASDPLTNEAWHEKAITLCNRIAREIGGPDDGASILRSWIDLVGARGLKIIHAKKGIELVVPDGTIKESAYARCG
jgi:hypothetical protein